jgi:hypothetical protein
VNVESHPWKREGTKIRCLRHDDLFDPSVRTCLKCDDDPGPEVSDEIDEPLPAAPEGCLDSSQIERWFVTIAQAERRAANRLANDRVHSASSGALICKHREVAIKAMRAAAEIALRREDEALVKAREKRIRDRMRKASH